MIAAERNQRRAGLDHGGEAYRPGHIRRLITEAVTAPVVYSIAAGAWTLRGIKRLVRGKAEPAPQPSAAELFLQRMEEIEAKGKTLHYLLQSCILQIELIVNPRPKVDPLKLPRSMPAANLRIRRRRHYRLGVLPARRGISLAITLTLIAPLAVTIAALTGVLVYDSYVKDWTDPQAVAVNEPSRGARIYDRNGRLLYEYVDNEGGVRIPVKLEDVSDAFLAATIATEDHSFYTNPGVNPRGLARAAWENFSPFFEDQAKALEGSGGSSITQQLVKNLYIPLEERTERSVDRKLREAAYALELTDRFDKRQILEWYVNQISYGGIYNGVEAASQGYFGKHAKDLTLAEAALLAGIPQSPAAYDPVNQPEAARVRRDQILDLMTEEERIQIGDDRFYTPAPG